MLYNLTSVKKHQRLKENQSNVIKLKAYRVTWKSFSKYFYTLSWRVRLQKYMRGLTVMLFSPDLEKRNVIPLKVQACHQFIYRWTLNQLKQQSMLINTLEDHIDRKRTFYVNKRIWEKIEIQVSSNVIWPCAFHSGIILYR